MRVIYSSQLLALAPIALRQVKKPPNPKGRRLSTSTRSKTTGRSRTISSATRSGISGTNRSPTKYSARTSKNPTTVTTGKRQPTPYSMHIPNSFSPRATGHRPNLGCWNPYPSTPKLNKRAPGSMIASTFGGSKRRGGAERRGLKPVTRLSVFPHILNTKIRMCFNDDRGFSQSPFFCTLLASSTL